MTKSAMYKATCSTVLAGALLVGVAPAASATPTESRNIKPAAIASVDGDGAYLDLASQGYTYEEAVEAFKDSSVVTVVRGEIPEGRMSAAKPGVSLGWYVYVKLSKSQARAVNAGSAATAAGLIGAITGGIGAAVAAGVYAAVVSMGNDKINKCKKGVEFKFTYLAKFKGVKCY